MGHKIKLTDPNEEFTRITGVLRRAIKFENIGKLNDIINAGDQIFRANEKRLHSEAKITWNDLKNTAHQLKAEYEKHKNNTRS